MSPVLERVRNDEEAFVSSRESIAVVTELERRRELIVSGEMRLLSEDESWERIRAAGYNV